MEKNVLDYEPSLALFVPDREALVFYRAIALFGKKRLKTPGGLLYFEINAQCGESMVNMLKAEGYKHIELVQDISGKDRIIKAEL